MSNKVTLQDIAEALGVSRNTVSKAMNNTGSVSDATKNRIFQKAAEMGYKQFGLNNPKQDTVETSESKQIALFANSLMNTSHFGSKVIDAFQERISSAGYTLSIFLIRDSEISNLVLPAGFDRTPIDGIICLELFSETYSRFLCSKQIPLLFVDTVVNRHDLDLPSDLIYMENKVSTYNMLKSLITGGVSKIGFVGDFNHCNSFFERWESFLTVLKDFNLAFEKDSCILDTDSPLYGNSEWLCQKVKEMKEIPQAFFCANDFIAINLMRALKQAGYSVPEDVKVCGFDNSPESTRVEPSLPTVNIPSLDMGCIAADILVSRIRNPSLPFRTTYVKTEVIERNSTGSR